MYKIKKVCCKHCRFGVSYPRSQQWTDKSTAQVQNGGLLAGGASKRPHHPTTTDLVGMKDPDNKPRLTQNGGHRLLARAVGDFHWPCVRLTHLRGSMLR